MRGILHDGDEWTSTKHIADPHLAALKTVGAFGEYPDGVGIRLGCRGMIRMNGPARFAECIEKYFPPRLRLGRFQLVECGNGKADGYGIVFQPRRRQSAAGIENLLAK